MYHEVRQENIALTGNERQSLDLHVVEHLAEQTEIKVGRGEGGIAQAGDARNNAAADQSAYHREGCDGALAGLPFVQQEMVYPEEVNEKEGVGDQHRQQEQEFILSFLTVICQPPGNADRCAKQKEPRVCFQRGQQCGDYREQGKIQHNTAQQESGRNVRAKGESDVKSVSSLLPVIRTNAANRHHAARTRQMTRSRRKAGFSPFRNMVSNRFITGAPPFFY